MAQEIKIGIVILNFNHYNYTIKCVESILKQQGVKTEIVIVDNSSIGNDVDYLNASFENYNHITIIELSQNIGFSRGNNIGIEYLLKKGYRYILVLNNDTLFTAKNILVTAIEKDESSVGLINLRCSHADGSVHYPSLHVRYNVFLCMGKGFLDQIINSIKILIPIPAENNKQQKATELLNNKKYKDVMGCAFILTPAFFEFYNKLYPKTFLFCEEFATAILLEKAGLKSVNAENDYVIHFGGKSTDTGNIRKKLMVKQLWFKSLFKVFPLVFMSYNMINKKMEEER